MTESIKGFCSKHSTDNLLFLAQLLPFVTKTDQQRTTRGLPHLFNDNDDDNELYGCHSGSHCFASQQEVPWRYKMNIDTNFTVKVANCIFLRLLLIVVKRELKIIKVVRQVLARWRKNEQHHIGYF